MNNQNYQIRNPDEKEFLDIYHFVSKCKPLEQYDTHFYKIMLRFFPNTCFLLLQGHEIIGFILGFISQNHSPNTYFLWQIGINPSTQGKGLGIYFLGEVEKYIYKLECFRIELTIDPENIPSQKLFEKMGYSNLSEREGKVVMVKGNKAVQDYYKPGRHFMVYEKLL